MFLQILNVLYVVAVVLLLFNLTIFVHELGHYLVGRWRGAKIEQFAIWFGPAVWSKTINGVEFRLGCIPLGGYVKFPQLAMEAIEGKSETPVEELEPLKPRDKIPILFAGSFANLLLGVLVAWIVSMVGVPKDGSDFDLTVGHVSANSPEGKAGIRSGDRIVSINGKSIKDWDEIIPRVALSLSEKVKVGVLRGGENMVLEVLPSRDNFFKIRKLGLEHVNTPVTGRVYSRSPAQKAGLRKGDEILEVDGEKVLGIHHLIEMIGVRGNQPTRMQILRNGRREEFSITPRFEKKSGAPRIGVEFGAKSEGRIITVYPSPWQQVADSLLIMADTINALLHKKTTGVTVGDLAGPVGIGWSLYLRIMLDFRLALSFLVLLNINLAVINLFPIPVLDGGHIVFSMIESIRRKPLNQKMMEATQTVFVALLITFMVYVTFNDITRVARFGITGGGNKNDGETALPVFEEKIPP